MFAFAKEKGVRSIEEFALTLGDHFIGRPPRRPAPGSRSRSTSGTDLRRRSHRTTIPSSATAARPAPPWSPSRAAAGDRRAWAVSGAQGPHLLKTTGSEFWGFLKDEYTTLQETNDRILATSLVARWRYDTPMSTSTSPTTQIRRDAARAVRRGAQLALQQTLYAMGEAVLQEYPEVAEIKFTAPNKHHFLVDLSPFGCENPGEVFIAADRPYGLIEATVRATTRPTPGAAWNTVPGFC